MGERGITTVISDFGGVLTTPLVSSFAAVQDETGIPMEELGKAMGRISEREGKHPLFELETGRVTEVDFLAKLADELEPVLGHRPEMHRFAEIYFEALNPNEPMIELMRELKASGLTDGDADQQRARVGAALALDAAGGRDLRAGRRLGLRRHAQARPRDLRAHAGAPRRPRAGRVPVHRRHRGQRRGRPRARHLSRPLPPQRPGDRGDPRGRGPRRRFRGTAASSRSPRGPRCRARSPRGRAPSGGGARATRARCRARAPR